MAKKAGLGDNLYVGGYNLSGGVGSLGRVAGGPAALNLTGIDKSAFERLGGRRDGGLDFQSFFNDAAGQAFPVLSALPTTDVHVMYARGTTLGDPGAGLVAKQVNYDGNRAEDGSLMLDVATLPNDFGVQWGKQLTAGVREDTSATNGTGVDFGTGSTSFGAQFFLHVFAFTGTSATIKVQESSDDGGGDAYGDVTGGGFTAVTSAPFTERIATSATATVERYLRAVTTGTFTVCNFALLAVRNDTAVTF